MSTEKKEKIENFSVVEETKSYIITEIRSNCGKICLRHHQENNGENDTMLFIFDNEDSLLDFLDYVELTDLIKENLKELTDKQLYDLVLNKTNWLHENQMSLLRDILLKGIELGFFKKK